MEGPRFFPQEQFCRHDARIVHDQQIARPQIARQLIKSPVFHLPRAAVIDHQPALVARFGGRGRNGRRRQFVIQFIDRHGRHCRRTRPASPR